MNKKNMVNYDFGDLKNQFPKEPETVHQSVLCTLQKLTEKSEGKGDSISGKHCFFRKRKVALAAAIVALCGTTAFAAEVFQWEQRAIKTFGEPSQEMQDKMAANGVATKQEAYAFSEGITVTALQTLQDERKIYILLEVTSEEQIIGGSGFKNWKLLDENGENIFSGIEQSRSYGCGYSFFNGVYDSVLTNHGYLTLSVRWDEGNSQLYDKLIVCLDDYCYTSYEDGEGEERKINGHWEIPVEINNAVTKNLTKVCETGQEIVMGGVPMTVKQVILTPMTMEMTLQRVEEQDDWCKDLPVIYGIENLDGSVLEIDGTMSHGFSMPKEGDGKYDAEFYAIVDVENAAAILMECEGEKIRIELQQ